MTRITVTEDAAGTRLDALVSASGEFSRSAAQKLIESGAVTVNGSAVTAKNHKTKPGDEIVITPPESVPLDMAPAEIPLSVLYEDNDLLVVDKPVGMVVHPAPGNYSDTLVNALLAHCGDSLSGINGVMRPGIVHRIDKETSGVLLVAKNDKAHLSLAEQIKEHTARREYLAVVHGRFPSKTGTVNAPIGRRRTDRKKMAVTAVNSKPAVTHYEVLEEFDKYSLILCRLETGRTHQIRVHMAHIGHPVAGDRQYGRATDLPLTHQCLHAIRITFRHPSTGEEMTVEAPLPEYFAETLGVLRKENANGKAEAH